MSAVHVILGFFLPRTPQNLISTDSRRLTARRILDLDHYQAVVSLLLSLKHLKHYQQLSSLKAHHLSVSQHLRLGFLFRNTDFDSPYTDYSILVDLVELKPHTSTSAASLQTKSLAISTRSCSCLRQYEQEPEHQSW